MRDEKKIYEYIKEIAEYSVKNNETISRADVAYILRSDKKVKCSDGAELSGVIYRAYKAFDSSEAIQKAIVTNNGTMSLVDQYELNAQLEVGNTTEALSLVQDDLNTTNDFINEAKRSVNDAFSIELASDLNSLHKWLQGTNGIDTIRTKSSALMQNYGKMVDGYVNAELSVKNIIHDFVELRNGVQSVFLQYSNALVDVFGDAIKVVAPKLFDFDSIQWLDVNAMQKQIQLDFNKLDENCTLLLGEIADHYQKTVDQLPVWMKMNKAIGPKGGIYGTLVMGVLSYLHHWMDAQEKTVQMQREYIEFESSIKKDRQQINSDLLRLATIHKVLNDLYIPKADAFLRLCNNVLSDDLQKLLDSLYTGGLETIKQEREAILKRLADLESSINDHMENIALYDSQLIEWQGMLDSQKENYDRVINEKPIEPGVLKRVFTLGMAQKNYQKDFAEWNEQNGRFVSAYEETIMDVYEGSEDKKSHMEQLKKDKAEYEACKNQLKAFREKITEQLECSPQQKLEILKNLKNLISLLQAGKSIMESKLDDRLVQATSETNIAPLSAEVENNLRQFAKSVFEEIKEEGGSISHALLKDFDLSEEDVAVEMDQSLSDTVAKATELVKNWSYLQTEQMKSQLEDAVYRQEMERMKQEFQSTMATIDKKNKVLLEVLKRANTATDVDTLRNALVDLAGVEAEQLSVADLEAILKGEKKLEI